uniref:Uncharacterized protein n=1 Tax=Sphaerodactylus townsendi TaxID=933632 RepID=A0ACB8FDZ9_9SAUR
MGSSPEPETEQINSKKLLNDRFTVADSEYNKIPTTMSLVLARTEVAISIGLTRLNYGRWNSFQNIRMSLSRLLNCPIWKTQLVSYNRLPAVNGYQRMTLKFRSEEIPSLILNQHNQLAAKFDIIFSRVFHNTTINSLISASALRKIKTTFIQAHSELREHRASPVKIPVTNREEIKEILDDWKTLEADVKEIVDCQHSIRRTLFQSISSRHDSIIQKENLSRDKLSATSTEPVNLTGIAPTSSLLPQTPYVKSPVLNKQAELKGHSDSQTIIADYELDMRLSRVLHQEKFYNDHEKTWAQELGELETPQGMVEMSDQ